MGKNEERLESRKGGLSILFWAPRGEAILAQHQNPLAVGPWASACLLWASVSLL